MDNLQTNQNESLLRQVLHLVPGSECSEPMETLVPIDDSSVFLMLVSEMARMTANEAGTDLYVCVDGQTASQIDAVDALHASAKELWVFGPAPREWQGQENVHVCPRITDGRDMFLLAVSPNLCLMILCEQQDERFSGAWTSCRAHANRLLDALAGSGEETIARKLKPMMQVRQDTRSLSCSLQLTSLLTHQLALRQRDIVMDKDELSSVLNILKAVSARRRAHDILYVFVEQIARAVPMDRCSVLRVWGGEDRGHVLASHEDETVADLAINLQKYPEVRRAIETRHKVIINDVRRDPLMRPCLDEVLKSGITSLIVIPIVLFDPNIGSFLLRAARTGAPFTLREISFCEIVAEAAANALERGQLFESIQKANERLEHLAITDGLTGLYNHRYFRQRLEDEFERAHRYTLPLSCMILDIDNFKRINDTYGHLNGDIVLRGIADTAQRSVRKSDIVARYGGEEFVVIMPQTGLEGARAQAERVRRETAAQVFENFPEGVRITVSIGVAVYDPETMLDCEAMLRIADGALYKAKREGKNRVIVG